MASSACQTIFTAVNIDKAIDGTSVFLVLYARFCGELSANAGPQS